MNCKIALLGTSIAIDSVAAALAAAPGLELLRFKGSPVECLPDLHVLAPDAVVFDMAVASLDQPILELLTHPGLLLIGCDLATQQMVLLSGEPARLATVDDLLQVLSVGDRRREQAMVEGP